jgi:hypothetical protein
MLTVVAFATAWLVLPQIVLGETVVQPASQDQNKATGSAVAVPIDKPPVRGAPGGRVGGGTRGGDQTFTLSVLAPNHTALTGKEQPDLYWYVSKPISTPIVFTLSDDGAMPVVEQTLTPPVDVGIHRVRLADFGVRLALGKQYRWFVSLVSDSKRRSRDILAGATIERADPVGAETMPSMQDGGPGEAHHLAEAGHWYDAIAILSDEIDHNPSEPSLRTQRAGLLQQVGLTEIADFDLNQRGQ